MKDLMRSTSLEVLKKIPIDVKTLEEPIRSIVEEKLTNNCNLQKFVG